tara:strand:+ start:197 stop:493 length:297 start_codon:yes stop_codon:yes gene_type:complete
MKNEEEKEEAKVAVTVLSILTLILMMCLMLSCSAVETALEIPQHIQQRIMETENTYKIDIQYLVWNDLIQSYEWEYYSDIHVGADESDGKILLKDIKG